MAFVATALLTILTMTQASESFYPTDQSRHDQLNEVNSFVQYYTESLDAEVNAYEKLGVIDKELRPYMDAASVVQKLVKHSWLKNMKPDDRYSVPSGILERQQAIDDLAEEIKRVDRNTPVTDAILLFSKVDPVSLLGERKETILFGVKSLEGSIDNAKRAEDFNKADMFKVWKTKLLDQLELLESDIRQAAILKEMILQSYILIFNPRHDGKTVKVRHSNGLVENERDFPVPPLDNLSVLQEINRNYI